MDMYGYTGKILRVDLTNRKISTLETKEYEEWGGGHGIGSAIFWDLCKDKTISAFDSRNVVTIMTSPLAGAAVPSASRTEVQGLGPQGYPIEWFTRSNFGGRFAPMLKYAGWDGIVIEGKADKPVWIDVRNSNVQIKDADWLWGLDTWEAQEQIWREVSTGQNYNDWWKPGDRREDSFFKQVAKKFMSKIGPWLMHHKLISVKMEHTIAKHYLSAETHHERTTQKPAVLAIGPAGENLCRFASLIHDAGCGAGQGGFGAVFGSKNLKAISVIGTGSVRVADPKTLLEIRMNKDNARKIEKPNLLVYWEFPESMRVAACTGCKSPCKGRYAGSHGNESQCMESMFSAIFTTKGGIDDPEAKRMGADLLQKYGINAYHLWIGLTYLIRLNKMGVLGKGMKIDCDLPFEKLTDVEFMEKYIKLVAYREGVGNDLAEGFPRAAEKWGRIKQDLKTGALRFPHWGDGEHYDPRCQVCWGFSSILSSRDYNDHTFTALFLYPTNCLNAGVEPIPAEKLVEMYASVLSPYEGNMRLLDFSTENIYSDNMVKFVSWHMYYDSFWKNSALFCDTQWPSWDPTEFQVTVYDEVKFWNGVTGRNFDLLEGQKVGKRIWNLDNAIWTLQGRHRDMVHFADYVYDVPKKVDSSTGDYGPGIQDGKWKYINFCGRALDKEKFEEFKTRFYNFQGWDTATGWPTRSALESMGLSYVADELDKHGRLGTDKGVTKGNGH